jgi:hypothetical protein
MFSYRISDDSMLQLIYHLQVMLSIFKELIRVISRLLRHIDASLCRIYLSYLKLFALLLYSLKMLIDQNQKCPFFLVLLKNHL